MRPVMVAAVLLLVVLMSMSASAESLEETCRTVYPATACRNNVKGQGGWYQFGANRCVKAFFDNKHLTYMDAEYTCRRYPGGHLVSFHSLVELHQVECTMYRATPEKALYWIGLYRHRGGHVWTDGSDNKFTRWAPGQPNFLWGMEVCVEMNYKDWGLWNDEMCDKKHPYVCQVELK